MNTILAIVVVLAVAYVLGRRQGRRETDASQSAKAPACDWRPAPDDDRGRLKAYDCAVCRNRGYAMGEAKPSCKRNL